MSLIAITRYQPHPTQSQRVAHLLAGHWHLLHQEGLVTDQPAFVMVEPGTPTTFLEVLAWRDEDGPDRAAQHPRIGALWQEIQALCTQEIAPIYHRPLPATYGGGG